METRKIEGVLENILRVPSLPIGALLVLEVGDNEVFHSGPISGGPTPTSMPQMNLLDGQQRMTALWRSLTDDYDEFTLFVSLRDEESPEIEIVKRHLSKSGNGMLLWADSPTECLERNLAPVSMLCPGSKSELAMDEWTEAAGTEKGTDRRIMRYRQRLKRVFNIDIETCNSCGGGVKLVACIEAPEVIEKILTHLDSKATGVVARRLPPSWAPPQGSLSG